MQFGPIGEIFKSEEVKMWNQLDDRKWELKHGDRTLATIFHKPTNDRFSLFVCAPKTYRKIISIAADSYHFDTLEEAQQGFKKIILEDVAPYCRSILEWLESE
jgi:hypothetical protein